MTYPKGVVKAIEREKKTEKNDGQTAYNDVLFMAIESLMRQLFISSEVGSGRLREFPTTAIVDDGWNETLI